MENQNEINTQGCIAIHQRILSNNGQLKGYTAAVKNPRDGKFYVGYSLKNKKDPFFDKAFGLHLAYARACICGDRTLRAPVSIRGDIEKMIERGKKYFRTEYSGNCLLR